MEKPMSEVNVAQNNRSTSSPRSAKYDATDSLERLAVALRGLQYGEVRVIVQDGLVVQIEKTDRQRLR